MITPRCFSGVMISSTFVDMEEHRKALIRAIRAQGLADVSMENETARSDVDLIESSLQLVRDASAYIVVVGRRYGQIPICPKRNPKALSITELEFNEAQRLERPMLVFIMGEKHQVHKRHVELDRTKKRKLDTFRERVKLMSSSSALNRVFLNFSNLEEFENKIVTAVDKLRAHLDRVTAPSGNAKAALEEYLRFRTNPMCLPRVSDPNLWFEEICDRALFTSDSESDPLKLDGLMRTIRSVIGQDKVAPVILTTCSDQTKRGMGYNLIYYLRESKEQKFPFYASIAGSKADRHAYKIDNASDQDDVFMHPRMGHWLLGKDLNSVPMAVFVQLSKTSPTWHLNFSEDHPLVFTVCASPRSRGLNELVQIFDNERKISCGNGSVENVLKNLKTIFDRPRKPGAKNPMGETIMSAINLPVHGHPSINLQIWSQSHMTFSADRNSYATENNKLPLSLEQIMVLRLCAERVQGLVAHSMSGLYKKI